MADVQKLQKTLFAIIPYQVRIISDQKSFYRYIISKLQKNHKQNEK